MRTRPKSIVRPCSWVGCGGEGVRWGVRWRRWGQERKERQGLAGLSRRGWSKHHRRRRRPRAALSPRRRLRYRASYVRPILSPFSAPRPTPRRPQHRRSARVRRRRRPCRRRPRTVVRAPSPAAAPTVADTGRIRPAPRPTPSRLPLHAGAHFPPRRVLVIRSTRRLELFLPTAAPICVPLPQHSMHAPCTHSTRLGLHRFCTFCVMSCP